MKVLFIHTKYMERGGEDSVVESEVKLLKENGYDVEFLYFDNGKHTFINLMLLPFNLISYFRTINAIKKSKPDIVHIHNLHFAASYSVIWAISHMNIPMVRTLHNYRMFCPSGTLFHNNEIYMKSFNQAFPWHAVKDKVYRNSYLLTFWLALSIWLHKRLGTHRKVSRYITLNDKSRSIFLSSGLKLRKSQVVTKPNFIRSNMAPSALVRGNHFLYIGRLSPEKGIDVMLKAFATNGLPLTIIGDGPMRNNVIKQQEQNPNIRWLGFQNKNVIDNELQQCTALLMPSVCLEGMPLTILESFAWGTPVITSKLGAMETMVTHNSNGLLFAPNNADSLNRQLIKWQVFTEAKKHDFSEHALHTYEHKYTPQKNLSALLSIYYSAMNKKPRYNSASHQPQLS